MRNQQLAAAQHSRKSRKLDLRKRQRVATRRASIPRPNPAALLDLTADAAASLVDFAPRGFDKRLRATLRSLLDPLQLERCTVYRVGSGKAVGEIVCYARRAHVTRAPKILHFDEVLPVRRGVASDAVAFASGPGDGPQLLVTSPAHGEVRYGVAFSSVHRPHRWYRQEVARLRLLAHGLIAAIRNKARDDEQAEAQRFERLISNVSLGFAGVRWDRIDQQIDAALRGLRDFTGSDQCAFFTVFPERGEACLSYVVGDDGTTPVGSVTDYAKVTPWLYENVVRRMQTVSFSQRDELPAEASLDRQHLEAVGTQAALYVPYAVDGVTRYVLAVVTRNRSSRWRERFVNRLEVLGTLLASALNRKASASAQAQAQQRLGATQRFSQATLDALNEYVGVLDVAGNVVETSDRWRTLADGSAAAPEAVPIGGNFLRACEAVTGASRDATAKLARGIRGVLAGDRDEFRMEWARPLDGELRWLDVRVHRFVVDGVPYAAVSHEDITAHRKSEQELQDLRAQQWHAERITQTGVLIGSIAHELSQPLTAILSNAQAGIRFMASDSLDPQEMREILSDIIADDKRAADIIESLRVMLRRQKTGRGAVDVAGIVRDVVRLLHSELVRRHVEVEEECVPCVVVANRAQLQQVVLNLMVNGIEAMLDVFPGERRLRVSVGFADATRVRIVVCDSGIGIAEEELAKAFDAFWTTKSGGTGMGLPICHSIVESHGGRIWGERNRDAGSTFIVELPVATSSSPAAPVAAVAAP